MPSFKITPLIISNHSPRRNFEWLWTILRSLCFACLIGTHAKAEDVTHRFITIGTGEPTGIYHAVGEAICKAVNRQAAQQAKAGAAMVTKCVVAASGGSVFNIRQVGNGTFTFVLAQSNVAQLALREDPPEPIMPVLGLRSVLALHDEALQIVVPAGKGINRLEDLIDKPISPGSVGSGTRQLFFEVLAAHGFSEADFVLVGNLAPLAQARALCDGDLSALVVVSAFPAPIVEIASNECDVRLLDLDFEIVAKLAASTPNLKLSRVSDRTFAGFDALDQLLSVRAGLFTRGVVPDQVVREVVKAVIEEVDLLRQAHSSLADLQPGELSAKKSGVQPHSAAKAVFVAGDYD